LAKLAIESPHFWNMSSAAATLPLSFAMMNVYQANFPP
jgi:hypothetical protein